MHLHFSAILLALLSGTSAFIFDQTCHVPLRCSCALPFIKCEDRMLPRVPNFNMTTNHSSLYLQLQNNRILLVQDLAFDGLKTDKLYLDMSVNRIHSIGDNAFSGLEDAI
ncbi:hypothetical protein MAR_020338, partial [Mya arenaria]